MELILYLISCAILIYYIYRKIKAKDNSRKPRIEIIINKIKLNLKGDNLMVEIQTDQQFPVTYKFTDDGGVPVDVETIDVTCSAPEIVSIEPQEKTVVGSYTFLVKGNMENAAGGVGTLDMKADARFGDGEKLFENTIALSVVPNEADYSEAVIGEITEQ